MNQGIDKHSIAIAIVIAIVIAIIIIILIAGMFCTRQPTFSFLSPQLLSIVLAQRSIYQFTWILGTPLSEKIQNIFEKNPKSQKELKKIQEN